MGVFGHPMVNSERKTALLFPGQGAQYVGMGKDFYENFKESRDVFEQASDTLGFNLAELCFRGKQEELNKTSVCQPAILVTSIAILEAIRRNASVRIDACLAAAGLSLGEYTAHAAAGSIAFKDAVNLVYKRGLFMQEACDATQGGMVSIIGLQDETVEQICAELRPEGVICTANYNSPGQVAISGGKLLLEKASSLAKERGARMAVPLKVDGAFHSDFMMPASGKLAKELESTPVSRPRIPVVANVNAQYVMEPAQIKASLVTQLNSPVRWHQSVSVLIRDGFNLFYEIGPGKTISGLMKRIDPAQEIRNVDTLEAFKNLSK